MGKNDAALRQVFQLGQEVMGGKSGITAQAIDDFRRRPQGPHGHPLLVRSERLTHRWDDLQVSPDGQPCFLKKQYTDEMCGLLARSGQNTWLLKYAEPAICEQGRIIGFNKQSVPIIEMIYSPTSEPGCSCSRVYIGDKPVPHTDSQVTQKSRLFWTMGADGRLYGLRRQATDPTQYELVGYNAITGAEEACVPRGPHESENVCDLAVVSDKLYAFVTNGAGSTPLKTVTIEKADQWRAQIVRAQTSATIVLVNNDLWLVRQDLHTLEQFAEGGHRPSTQKIVWNAAHSYLRGLRFDTGYTAFITERPHGQEGWYVGGNQQPGFERVSGLFMEACRWRYWALAENHLFLMELPLSASED